MRLINAKGGEVSVDDDMFDILSQKKWYIDKRGYARRTYKMDGALITEMLHQVVMRIPSGSSLMVDHINGDRLDNRRENLRIATKSQNGHNQGIQRTNTSGYKGVTFHSSRGSGKWIAQIRVNGKRIHIGSFDDINVAAHEYNKAAIKHHGEFARLNVAGLPAFKHANGE